MSDEPGGITSHFTDDGWRDAYALVVAVLHEDASGEDAVLANADLRGLASILAAVTAGALTSLTKLAGGENYEALTLDQAADLAKLSLINGLRAAGAPEPPTPPSVAELLRGVAAPAVHEAPGPHDEDARQRDLSSATGAVLLAVLDEDQAAANVILRSCTHADTAQVVVNLAGLLAGSCDDRAAFRDHVARALQAGHPLQPGEDDPDDPGR